MRTIDKIITRVNGQYGAPMGRHSVGMKPDPDQQDYTKVYDCQVPLDNGGYDRGGAYWGFPNNVRVQYTKDLSYIKFYRLNRR